LINFSGTDILGTGTLGTSILIGCEAEGFYKKEM